MKRLIALCLTAACLISLVGCAGDTNMDEKKPNNTASAYALALASYPEMAPYPNEMEYFDEKTSEFDSDSFDVVTIKAGDTVESVASRYAVSPEEKQELVEAICEVNDVNIDSRMNSGRKLSVPVLKTDSSMVARK